MARGQRSGLVTNRVLVLGDDDRAADLATTLEDDGVDVVRTGSAPVALATLDSVDADCLVLVDGTAGRPADFFGAAQRKGHQVPGVFVGSKARQLPPSVEQAPATVEAAAATVRQKLLAQAAADAEPVATEDPLSAYGSTVAHELRNHVSAAGMAVESLEGPTTDQAQNALERLRDLATEAEAVAAGEVPETETVDVAAAAGDAADRITAAQLTLETPAGLSVDANRALLVLLLENLFRNAVEHAGDDDGVTVELRETDAGFAVVDDGPGFETDRPFEWGYSTGSGQGTGLAVVRRIAQAHGWHVVASNEDGARIDVVVE